VLSARHSRRRTSGGGAVTTLISLLIKATPIRSLNRSDRQKHSVTAASAMPRDVRRWLCPAVEPPFSILGYAFGAAFGLALHLD